jgi:hypothetical protein
LPAEACRRARDPVLPIAGDFGVASLPRRFAAAFATFAIVQPVLARQRICSARRG